MTRTDLLLTRINSGWLPLSYVPPPPNSTLDLPRTRNSTSSREQGHDWAASRIASLKGPFSYPSDGRAEPDEMQGSSSPPLSLFNLLSPALSHSTGPPTRPPAASDAAVVLSPHRVSVPPAESCTRQPANEQGRPHCVFACCNGLVRFGAQQDRPPLATGTCLATAWRKKGQLVSPRSCDAPTLPDLVALPFDSTLHWAQKRHLPETIAPQRPQVRR